MQTAGQPSSPPPTREAADGAAETPAIVREELAHLARTRRALLENPERPGASADDIARDLIRLRDEMRGARSDDKAALSQQMGHLTHLLDQVRRGRRSQHVDPDSPYFAHLQVEEDGRRRDVFLGRATRLGDGIRIVDWRNAPISRLFYQYQEGDEYAEEIGGKVREGVVTVRRTVHVAGGELLRVDAPSGRWVRAGEGWTRLDGGEAHLHGGQGQALWAGTSRSRLGSGGRLRADKHLPDIAALIDPDQFELITAPDSGVVVLGGTAGSGKTTVALHRIAWLAYDKGAGIDPRRALVVVWGRAMRDYVAHVLPALGVEGVHVTTWTDWARKQVRRHFPRLPLHVADDTPEPVTRIKLHPAFAQLLAERVRARRAPARGVEAIEDWAAAITDGPAIARALGPDISPAALERAMRWTSEQAARVLARVEGDHEVDARLDAEDDALLLRAWQLRVGPLRGRRRAPLRHAHIVLDEVQDFSPIEVQVLLETTDEKRSVTLAGDTRQHISAHAGFTDWRSFLDAIGIPSTALSTLEVSYRSTAPIIRFALDVLDEPGPPPRTTRDGPPVELFRFTDHGACVAFLAEELRRLSVAEPLANVALLTPSPELSRLYADGLRRAEVPRVRRVVDQEFAFAPGIDVVEAQEVKGLEFDYVIVVDATARHYPDTPRHRRLLHVAATRAVHQLWLTATGTPSPILPPAVREGGEA